VQRVCFRRLFQRSEPRSIVFVVSAFTSSLLLLLLEIRHHNLNELDVSACSTRPNKTTKSLLT
jgi:hypothetical protein